VANHYYNPHTLVIQISQLNGKYRLASLFLLKDRYPLYQPHSRIVYLFHRTCMATNSLRTTSNILNLGTEVSPQVILRKAGM